jgi:hypothetical protein
VFPTISPAGLHSSPNRFSNGLALEIGSGEAAPIRIPGAAPWGAASSSLTGGTGGHVVERVGSDVTASFIHLGRELGGETAQNFAKWLPCSGVFHGSNHEGNRAHEVVKACQGLGNVCRA